MKNKKGLIFAVILIVIILIGVIGYFKIINKTKPEDVLKQYIENINAKDYNAMYEKISSSSKNNISEEDFINRNKKIYEGIDSHNIEISINNVQKNKNEVKITYNEKVYTSSGVINFSNTSSLVKDGKTYKLNWTSKTIFPELEENYKVKVSSIEAARGEILDRQGKYLAQNGQITTIGIVPGKLGENKEEDIKKLSELTGVSIEYINTELSRSYVKDDTFVPIKKISKDDNEKKEALLKIPGIKLTNTSARVYPLGEEAAHLIGYVQKINEQELEQNKEKGYSSSSVIGKDGLEKAYEDRLRAVDGKEIIIVDEKGNKIKQLAKQDKKDGEDIKLTIDSKIQKQLYDSLKNDKGFFVVMNPNTGELLGAVSTPSYNSNDFVLGMTQDKWNELNNNEAKPMYNRFLQTYAPGSTFKPITAAIGLNSGKITKETTFSYSGLSWQKSASWGNVFITTLTQYNGPKNIKNALIHSDNIFFAQAAMQIGAETMCSSLNSIGFNEQIEFPLSLKKSTFSSDGKISNEKKLADTGYGQADVLVNPIHMASIYSSFANSGNMVKPYIEYNEDIKTTYLKENAFSKDTADEIRQDLIQVVENPEGTANDMKLPNKVIAGKTGTAELKKTADDTESGTLGWFDCFTVNTSSNDNMLIISMVENTQNNSSGGSHYLIKKIRGLFE